MLQDGAGSTRQLVDEEGAVHLSVSYMPWGDTMEIYGSGMLNLGYLGGVYDAGTGLIYMGNGQYYDPRTGRFLTRGAQQDQSNPYTPWNSDPAGMLIAPLALLALVFGRKKTRTKLDQFVILLVIVLSVGLSVSACNPPADTSATDVSVIQTNAVATALKEILGEDPTSTPTPIKVELEIDGVTITGTITVQPTSTASETPQLDACGNEIKEEVTPTPMNITFKEDMGSDWRITHYHYAMESDSVYPADDKVQVGGLGDRWFRRQFIYNIDTGIPLQGTGVAEDECTYITIDWNRTKKEVYPNLDNWWDTTDPVTWFFMYGKGGRFAEGVEWSSIAVSYQELNRENGLRQGDHVMIEGYSQIFVVDDTGSFTDVQHIDIFIGATTRAEALTFGTLTNKQVTRVW